MYTIQPPMLDLMNLSNSFNQQDIFNKTQQVQHTINQKNNVVGKYEVFLKAAKAREDQYRGIFPAYLLCNPYKYDLKIKGSPIDDNINVELLDRETRKGVDKNGKRSTVSVASVEKLGNREIVIRFSLNLCSFHYKKRDFILKVTSKSTREELFVSTPFHTYARKRRSNKTKSPKKESVKKRKFVSIKGEEEIIPAQFPLLKKIKFTPQVQVQPQKIKCAPLVKPTIQVPVQVQPVLNSTATSPLDFEELLFQDKNFANVSSPSPLKNDINTITPTLAKKQKNFFSLDDFDDVVANTSDLFVNLDEKCTLTADELLPKSPTQSFFSQTIASPTLLPDFVVGTNSNNNNTECKGILDQLESQQRTSLAIQLMNQLSPSERQKVSMYMSCNNNPQHV